MLGLAPQVPELPLPQNPSCALWIQPLLFGAGTLDHGGEARWTIVTPPPIRGEILHAQVATLDLPTASLQTSSALRVAFPNR